jgi:uncharacterized protein (DUF305 family)
MNKKALIYGFASLLIATEFLTANGMQAQPQANAPQDKVAIAPYRQGMRGQSDQHFIVMMIPHHEGAVAMADLALSRAQHPEIKKLAEAIKTSQTREIQQMRTWYKQWYGTEVPAWGPGKGWGWGNQARQQPGNNAQPYSGPGMGMGQGHMGGPGRMGMGQRGTDLSALQNATNFDQAFIQQMIPHHQMAVMMSSMTLANSRRPEIRKLAQSIIDSQSAEIAQMQQWYQTWYPSPSPSTPPQ